MSVLVSALLLALVVSFLCSISEAALLSTTVAQAEALGDTRAGRTLRNFKLEVDVPIAAILILNTIANTIGATVAGANFVELYGAGSLIWFSLFFTSALLLIGEIVPKTLGAVHTSRFIVPVVYYVSGLVFFLRPVIWLTRRVTNLIRGKRSPITSLKEIRLLAELGKSVGAVEASTAEMIHGAARLRELSAYDVMVPRTAAVFLDGTRTLAENLATMNESGYSRFPFSKVGEADKVDGIVHTRDVLFAIYERAIIESDSLMGQPACHFLENLARDADYVLESMSLSELLRSFQETRNHQAIVVDEYGGTEGLVTLEDVLEEIVGEIQDESDQLTALVLRREDGSLVCRGRAETRNVFELIGESDVAESVSLGGYVAERMGRVPVVGDAVELGEHILRVDRATALRAERIIVHRK